MDVGGINYYLQTDFLPTANSSVDITIKGTATTSYKSGYLFGSRNGWNNQSFYMRNSVTSGSATNMTLYMGYGTERNITLNINASDKNVYTLSKGKFYVNDTLAGDYSDAIAPTWPIFLLAFNNAGAKLGTSPRCYVYGAHCYDGNDVMVRDYRPVIRIADNTQGLYDVINGNFIELKR